MTSPSRYRVVATAGHVDHGKSTLVKALTGIDPDRLREEQERHMTIDLGFASLRLPSEVVVGIVDVPGHRDFIHNMLAGLGGIDAVLLVVAADEGIMPQTREHLDIISLLEIKRGIVVISKADLVEAEWLELVTDEVQSALMGTSLAGAPICIVSSVTGQGLSALISRLGTLLEAAPTPEDAQQPRLPVDRVFSLRGHGTIVTGTLVGGKLHVGDHVLLQPSGTRARIRSLQTHGQSLVEALPGSRVAANLGGVAKEDLRRGEVLVTGDWLQPTTMFDGWLRYLDSAPHVLAHSSRAQLFTGTLDVMVRVRLLSSEELAPGESGWAQFICARPVPLASGDRFILRDVSPSTTIGGGIVVDAHATRRHRRFDPGLQTWLQQLSQATLPERVLLRLRQNSPVSLATVALWLDSPADKALAIVENLASTGSLLFLTGRATPESTFLASAEGWQTLTQAALAAVQAYHAGNPLRIGMAREELRRALRLRQAPFSAALERWLADAVLVAEGDRVRAPGWRVQLDEGERLQAAKAMDRLQEAGASGVTVSELGDIVGAELLRAMLTAGEVVRLPDDIVLAASVYRQAVQAITQALQDKGKLTVAEVRDVLASNRRATLALLSHLDGQGITRREGDYRLLGRRSQELVR
ncbi:MAG: selenocysteine-specific translation elongation factor [Anaerolineae bacterium]